MSSENFIENIITDLKVELTDEFDRNFERKAFFDTPWPETKRAVRRGTLMMRTGDLRNGILSSADTNRISWSNSMPYAALHNEGGTIKVTAGMKRYFWAMYYLASGKVSTKKDGTASRSKANQALSEEAQYWKSMALIKLGTELKIPQRQFIGHHPKVDEAIRQVIDDNVQEMIKAINQKFIR